MFDPAGSWLFLDASGLRARVGVWQEARWLGWHEQETNALETLFAGTHQVLADAQLSVEKLTGYIYVEGPGSVLGLRLAAMAIRTWQVDQASRNNGHMPPVWTCGSLHLAATLAWAGKAHLPFAIISEARQGLWQMLEVKDADPAALAATTVRETTENELPPGTHFHLPARKTWQGAPKNAQPVPVSLREHPEVLQSPELLRPTETAVPYAGRAPEYKKWAGAVK